MYGSSLAENAERNDTAFRVSGLIDGFSNQFAKSSLAKCNSIGDEIGEWNPHPKTQS
jgi:hypothetical protein